MPGDSQGELLVNVQIIPLSEDKNAERDKLMKPPNSIQPDMKDAFIEIIAIGIRDMKPYLFQPMVSPFLELELNSTGASYLAATEPTRRPMPNNPNFLEKILIPCKIPWKSIYATPLQLRSKDVRLGGFSKPVVGVGAVDVTTKIPWCEDTYIPPQSDIFAKDINKPIEGGEFDGLEASNLDSVSIETAKLQARRQRQLAEDGLIAMQEPLPIEHLLKERVKAEDNGAGVFGAMTHITLDGKKKTKKAENAFSDPDWSQDDGDKPPAWAVNRKVLDSELEDLLKTTPFETYDLTRGKAGALIPGQGLKVVGKFKGLVRVIEDPATAVPFFEESVLENLLNPKGYKIRLYVLKGRGFPSDKDMFGKSTPSDPYLRVTLGKQVFNDRNNAVENDVEVDFYKLITFDAELPGASQMVIQVLDKNDFRPDKLIGQTIIDLEDRWFDARWQKQGEENQVNPDSGDVLIKPRWQTKPIERRTLYNPTSRGQQGMVECWVDIMTPETALVFEPDDVSLPPKQIFEVRVVIWKSKNVPAMDKFSGKYSKFVLLLLILGQ